MYVTYVCISVILVLIGIVGSVYFIRFLKNANFQKISIPALSESLNTIFVGIFYLYCAVVMAQHINTNTPPGVEENDIAIIEETPGPSTEYYNEVESNENVSTVATTISSKFPNQDFLLSYQAFMKNVIKQNGFKKNKELETQPNITHISEYDCFEEIFMEYSMFLYSFLHSALSLIINSMKGSHDSTMTPKRKSQDTEEFPQNNSKSETLNKNAVKNKLKLTTTILVIFLVPILCIVTLYFILQYNMQMKLSDASTESTWDILNNPINVSTPEKHHEINNIVRNIYSIVNASRGVTPPMKHATYSNRKPKQLETCLKFNMMYRSYILVVFLLYFITAFYAKMKAMEMKTRNAKAAKQLNISIIAFALLWVFSILDMFLKTYIIEGRSNVLTDIFLSLGNLNHLSITLMNYLTAKELIKKYNLVGPQA